METKKFIMTVLLAAMSTAAIATTDNSNKTASMTVSPSSKSGKLYLTYVSNQTSDVKVHILDSKGRVISKDHVMGEKGFRRPYDISQLKNGAYTVKLIDGKETVHESSFLVDNSKSALRPVGQHKYQLTYKDSSEKDVNVAIYDKLGNLVFRDIIAQTDGFSKVYDMSNVDAKGFTFEVAANGILELHKK